MAANLLEVYISCSLHWYKCSVKGKKVKLSLCLTGYCAMGTCWGSGSVAPCILDLGTGWGWVVGFIPWPLCPQGGSMWCSLSGELGGPQSCSGHSGPLLGNEP